MALFRSRIFFRELISNGCDAITKLKKLDMMGEYNFPEGHKNKVEVILDPEKKTLKFIDTGLGMTADEVEKYITQIAFSGATQSRTVQRQNRRCTRSSDILVLVSILHLW